MTWRELGISIDFVALVLAAPALVFAIRAIWWQRRAGQPQRWVGLVVRGLVIAGLASLSALLLRAPSPPVVINQSAPGADSVVAFAAPAHDGSTGVVVGASARTGATLWTRSLHDDVVGLLRPLPDVILAVTLQNTVYALRASDGMELWRHDSDIQEQIDIQYQAGLIAYDGGQVFAMEPAPDAALVALDTHTGAVIWRISEPVFMPTVLAAGSGSLFVAGYLDNQSDAQEPEVTALREADGSTRWTQTGQTIAGGGYISWLADIQGHVVLAFGDSSAAALRASDGAHEWSAAAPLVPLPSGANAETYPTVATSDGASVYLLTQPENYEDITPLATLRALDAPDGTVRWDATVPRSSTPSGSPSLSLAVSAGVALVGPVTFAGFGDQGYNPTGSVLTAFDTASGRQLWRDNTPAAGVSWNLPESAAPQGAEGVIYLEGVQADPYFSDVIKDPSMLTDGIAWLYAVNVHTGAPLWRVRSGYVRLIYFIL